MNCIICKIIASEIPREIVFENEHVIAFADRHPVNDGHILVCPKMHFENLLETPSAVVAEIMDAVNNLAPRVMSAFGASSFNLIVNNGPDSGQVIMHTHFHIIPRFSDDGLKHWQGKEITQEQWHEIAEKICNNI